MSPTSESDNAVLKLFRTLTCSEFLSPQSPNLSPFDSEADSSFCPCSQPTAVSWLVRLKLHPCAIHARGERHSHKTTISRINVVNLSFFPQKKKDETQLWDTSDFRPLAIPCDPCPSPRPGTVLQSYQGAVRSEQWEAPVVKDCKGTKRMQEGAQEGAVSSRPQRARPRQRQQMCGPARRAVSKVKMDLTHVLELFLQDRNQTPQGFWVRNCHQQDSHWPHFFSTGMVSLVAWGKARKSPGAWTRVSSPTDPHLHGGPRRVYLSVLSKSGPRRSTGLTHTRCACSHVSWVRVHHLTLPSPCDDTAPRSEYSS